MICNYCHYPISDGGRFCEHCGKAMEYGGVSDQQTQKSMLPLVIVIFLNVLIEWINIFTMYFPYEIHFQLPNVIFLPVAGIFEAILYLIYIKVFKARKWEKVVLYIIIFLNSLLILAYAILPLQLHGDNFLMVLALMNLLTTFNMFLHFFVDLFLIIFFSLRLKNNRFLWLMVTGYLFYMVTFYSVNLINYFLYRTVVEPTLVKIMFILYRESGSIPMLAFAGVTLYKFLSNKRMDLNKIRNV